MGLLFVFGLYAGLLAMLEIGRRLALHRRKGAGHTSESGTGAVNAAVFGLLGLLISFSFSGAQARFEWRRGLIVEEANDIGTAYLRLDLLPAAAQPALRDEFRRYLDARLAFYAATDTAAMRGDLVHLAALQQRIWANAVAASRDAGNSQAPMLLLPALNAMFDIATTRTAAVRTHTPMIIFWLLAGLAMVAALLAGYDMAGNGARNWIHIVALATVLTVAVYVILDLEYPRMGLIDLRAYDRVLVDVRGSMQ